MAGQLRGPSESWPLGTTPHNLSSGSPACSAVSLWTVFRTSKKRCLNLLKTGCLLTRSGPEKEFSQPKKERLAKERSKAAKHAGEPTPAVQTAGPKPMMRLGRLRWAGSRYSSVQLFLTAVDNRWQPVLIFQPPAVCRPQRDCGDAATADTSQADTIDQT